MNTQRPLNVTIAAILLEVFSALNLVSPLILGASDEVPAFTGCLHVALGVAGLVASAGLWILKKWGVALAIVVSVSNALSATPGVFLRTHGRSLRVGGRGRRRFCIDSHTGDTAGYAPDLHLGSSLGGILFGI
jgi:hypothetical protein